MTVYELALTHLQSNGMAEEDAVKLLELYGGTQGKDLPWADIVPYLPKTLVARLDRAAVGWIHANKLAVGGGQS